MAELEAIVEEITSVGNQIRDLKAKGSDKDVLQPYIKQLTDLKEKYKVANNGVAYVTPSAPKEEKPKKEKASQEAPKERDGPSKKELNKQMKKEKRKEAISNTKGESSEANPITNESKPVPVTPAAPVVTKSVESIVFHPSASPDITKHVIYLTGVQIPLTQSASSSPHLPYYLACGVGSISGDNAIARYICRKAASSLYDSNNHFRQSQIDQWLDSSIQHTRAALLAVLESHLVDKTFLVGSSLSLADIALFVAVNSGDKNALNTNTARWYNNIKCLLQGASVNNTKKSKAVNSSAEGAEEVSSDGYPCPPLEGAVDGQVCTRFPPEPSGYLHIGHTKAVLLNQYYAKRYHGKLIVRFDDTNPSKEKEEYEDNILRDLEGLDVKPDKISHSSDYFKQCEEYARQMIREGLAFMDDTDQETMQKERLNFIPSKNRDTSVEENLAKFEALLKAETPADRKYCLRAKIDYLSQNGTLRDPVLYRYNPDPHHRTGTKYKAYPTYDFVCPIVDSIEGVTHAMRTTEYHDRDEQYHWLQKAMRLRHVHIHSFGKVSFIHTVLSKRKLNWFVENKYVDGWNDPRFPTVQGCIRRGMNIQALKHFILMQGASKRVINMEWDKFWSDNKKVLEDIAPRYMGVNEETKVLVVISNVDGDSVVSTQVHPQKPELGQRVLRRSKNLYIERDDCNLFSEGEEVTFLRWGNFVIDKIVKDETGTITRVEVTFNPEAKNFSKTKKVTWLAVNPDLVPCVFAEFDHLITKAKLEEDDDFIQYINPASKAETLGFADPCLRGVQAGDVIQLERKGFYRCDKPYGGSPDKPAVLFLIPDGRTKTMSTLGSKLAHR